MGDGEDMATPHRGEHIDWHVWHGTADELPPADARRVHVSRPFRLATLQALLDGCPELEEIRFMPSHRRLVGPGVRRKLRERGVALAFGRLRDGDHYDAAPHHPLRESLRRNAHGRRWELLQEHCPDDAALVADFVGLDGRPPLSQTRLAGLRGRSVEWVSRRLRALDDYLAGRPRGGRLDYEKIVARAVRRAALAEARRARQAQSPIPIPVGLPTNGNIWRQFLFAARVWVERPDLFRRLQEWDERAWDILVGYFGLQSGVSVSLEVLGQRYGISRARAQQIKNSAVRWLRGQLREEGECG